VAKRWRGFLVHVALARTYPVFYRLTQMHVRQPPRHPLLDRQLPSLLHVKALALLDEALDEALTKASVMPSTFGLRADLNGRIDTARRAGLLAPATAKRLHEARTRRNELAHEFDAMVDWDTMDADLIGIHASLVELGLSGPMPKLDVAWSRTPKGALKNPTALLGFYYRIVVTDGSAEVAEIVWDEEIGPPSHSPSAA